MSSAAADEAELPSEIARCSVREAARRLGISERAVRKRIAAGLLLAISEERGWTVILGEPPTDGASPAVPLAVGARPAREASPVDAVKPTGSVLAAIELAALVALVERLTERNAELVAEAARAEQLEAQLQEAASPAPVEASSLDPPPDGEASADEGGIQRKLAHLNPTPQPDSLLLAFEHVNGVNGSAPDEPQAEAETWWMRFFGR